MNHRDAIAAQIASRYSLPSTNLQENMQHFLRAGVPMANIMRHPAYAEMSALDQGGGGFTGGGSTDGGFLGGGGAAAPAPDPYQYPVDPADPADYSSGFEQTGSALLGDLGGLSQPGFANSVDSQVVGNALSSRGYGSSLGLAHAANVADQAMTALGIYDAIDTSHDVNAAVEEGGYTSPSPAPAPAYESPDPSSTIVGLPSDFTTSNVSMDTGPGVGFDAGAAIAADVAGLSGLNAGVNDAAAGYDASGGFSGDGSGGGGGGGGGGGK
jgi:hypothetical protein